MTRYLLSISFIGFFYLLSAQVDLIQVTDLTKIKQLGEVTLSPDGRQVAFVAKHIEPDEKAWEYKYINQIYLAVTEGPANVRQLTHHPAGASEPAWSPDGQKLAFTRNVEGKSQVFILSLSGGEPEQITTSKYGAGTPVWSPDGQKLAFTTTLSLTELMQDSTLNPALALPTWPGEKPGFPGNQHLSKSTVKADPNGTLEEIRAYLVQNEQDQKAKVVNKLNLHQEATVSSALYFSHLWITDPYPTATAKPLTTGFGSYSDPQFSPDGKTVFFQGDVFRNISPDREQDNAFFAVQSDGSDFRTILEQDGIAFNGLKISPSGKWLAFQIAKPNTVTIPELAIMPVGGRGAADFITYKFDRNKGDLVWSKDEAFIYYTSPSNGGVILSRVNRMARTTEHLSGYDMGVGGFDVGKDKLVYVKTEVANPYELFVADGRLQNSRRLTDFHTAWLKNKKLSTPQKKTFVNNLGQTVEYWVMKPTNLDAGKKYPMILEIHGGPTAMWGPGESSMWHEYQYYCSRGYGVVYANPRGSGGYGEAFMRSNIQDWSHGPASDVLKALDLASTETWVDTSRMAITGGSYAGYLIAWIVAHDHRFKAACVQRGVYDLSTFFGEANAWRLVPNYFGGYPWEDAVKPILDRESPMTYVDQIRTPLIIFHGEQDLRTGVSQSEWLYKSLKVLGRTVEYVRHPGATHEITRSGNNRQRIDQMLRTYEFFERFLK